jgi:predicted Zn-dependent peptidase
MLPREHLSLAIDIEADRMRNALIDPGDVASERTVILNEMDRGENEPTAVLVPRGLERRLSLASLPSSDDWMAK